MPEQKANADTLSSTSPASEKLLPPPSPSFKLPSIKTWVQDLPKADQRDAAQGPTLKEPKSNIVAVDFTKSFADPKKNTMSIGGLLND